MSLLTEVLMAGLLLEAKFRIPARRGGQVARPRLVARLRRGAAARLTLVCAPAGFGKTNLVTEWLASVPAEGRSVAWLSLDHRDNDPAVFWTYLVTALQQAVPGVVDAALSLLRSGQAPTEAVTGCPHTDGTRSATSRSRGRHR